MSHIYILDKSNIYTNQYWIVYIDIYRSNTYTIHRYLGELSLWLFCQFIPVLSRTFNLLVLLLFGCQFTELDFVYLTCFQRRGLCPTVVYVRLLIWYMYSNTFKGPSVSWKVFYETNKDLYQKVKSFSSAASKILMEFS